MTGLQVAESFYRILNDEADNEQAWMGLDEVAEANLKARTFVFFKVHDQVGDLLQHGGRRNQGPTHLVELSTTAPLTARCVHGVVQAGDLHDPWVKEEARELAAIHTKRGAATLDRLAGPPASLLHRVHTHTARTHTACTNTLCAHKPSPHLALPAHSSSVVPVDSAVTLHNVAMACRGRGADRFCSGEVSECG